jgi:hypothetical protein
LIQVLVVAAPQKKKRVVVAAGVNLDCLERSESHGREQVAGKSKADAAAAVKPNLTSRASEVRTRSFIAHALRLPGTGSRCRDHGARAMMDQQQPGPAGHGWLQRRLVRCCIILSCFS